jgi:putative selenate reductase
VKTDKFWPSDIQFILKWILEDEKKGSIFGIPQSLFFIPRENDPFRIHRYGELLETPLGVAAGPHTQLCQNIVSAYLTGARYIELKTVQILDEIEVTKPCIDMTDEGYNCEWSQELNLQQSFEEYLKAWIIIHVLKDRFGWGSPVQRGFIFNMSVGYNMEGILRPSVQRFLEKMQRCPDEKAAMIEMLAGFYPRVRQLDIPDFVSDSITISTMHGCPPDEVEKIGRYFIEERKLNTTIKMNPTLLGSARVRQILNEDLGYDAEVPDLAFDHDLKYSDAVSLIKSLLDSAEKSGVDFNIKLTNTLETINRDQNIPKNEKMAYMSGRALHPISINLAASLQEKFNGMLDISFSAGIDCFNLARVLACNLKPITVCSDILKPGGYGRLSQYLDEVRKVIVSARAKNLDEYVMGRDARSIAEAGLQNLRDYARVVSGKSAYTKTAFPFTNIKTPTPLSSFDCIQAPCMSACPAGQNIPAYMHYTAISDYEAAYRIIKETNPFPNVQGMVCDHLCETKCTRINYDNPLKMREIKRFIAQKFDRAQTERTRSNGIKIAIIGAGPSGLSCGHYLSLNGFETHVFEEKLFAGGWASDAIPLFRLDPESVRTDIDSILASGIFVHFNSKINEAKFNSLREEFDYIYIAAGAQQAIPLGVPGEHLHGVVDQLRFLSDVRRGVGVNLGKKVVIVGGGNSAMDAARTAKRLIEKDGEVTVLYRRTKKEMPAAPEEIEAMLNEGINLMELTIPELITGQDGKVQTVLCSRMRLAEKDASGRPRPVKIANSGFELSADTVISAIGQRVILDFLPYEYRNVNAETNETGLSNVFIGGDAVRGASTMIKAIADGRKVAEDISGRANRKISRDSHDDPLRSFDPADLMMKKAQRQYGPEVSEIDVSRRSGFDLVVQPFDENAARKEAQRCLQCDQLCWICVTVCPNRANIAFSVEPCEVAIQGIKRASGSVQIIELGRLRVRQKPQVLNIGDFCNECGNCSTFCPTAGAPYLDKPKFWVSSEAFANAFTGYHFPSSDRLEYKFNGRIDSLTGRPGGFIYESDSVKVLMNQDYTVHEAIVKGDNALMLSLRRATEMAILYKAARVPPLTQSYAGDRL